MSVDLLGLQYISQIQAEQTATNTQATSVVNTQTASAAQTQTSEELAALLSGTTEKSGMAAFAQALSDEISNLTQQSELGAALGDSTAFGVTENNISDMMKTEKGRGAIASMADSAISSVLYGTSDQDDSTGLSSLFSSDSTTDQLADTLQNLLDSIEAGLGSDTVK